MASFSRSPREASVNKLNTDEAIKFLLQEVKELKLQRKNAIRRVEEISDDSSFEDTPPSKDAKQAYKAWRKYKRSNYKDYKRKLLVGEFVSNMIKQQEGGLWDEWRLLWSPRPPKWNSMRKTYYTAFVISKMEQEDL